MTEVVLDASLFLAAISPAEIHHAPAKTLFDRHPEDRPFLVSSLFRVEVLAALSRRGASRELIDTVDVVVSGLRFHAVPIDAALIDSAAHVARSARLRAYDAVYVAPCAGIQSGSVDA